MAATIVNKTSPCPVNGSGKLAKPEYPNDGTGVLRLDPWLEPFQDSLRSRYAQTQRWLKTLNEHEGGLDKFSKVSSSSFFFASFVANPPHRATSGTAST